MSAQMITALRARAGALDTRAAELDAEPAGDPLESAAKGVVADQARWLAAEFRALADEAESAQPG